MLLQSPCPHSLRELGRFESFRLKVLSLSERCLLIVGTDSSSASSGQRSLAFSYSCPKRRSTVPSKKADSREDSPANDQRRCVLPRLCNGHRHRKLCHFSEPCRQGRSIPDLPPGTSLAKRDCRRSWPFPGRRQKRTPHQVQGLAGPPVPKVQPSRSTGMLLLQGTNPCANEQAESRRGSALAASGIDPQFAARAGDTRPSRREDQAVEQTFPSHAGAATSPTNPRTLRLLGCLSAFRPD